MGWPRRFSHLPHVNNNLRLHWYWLFKSKDTFVCWSWWQIQCDISRQWVFRSHVEYYFQYQHWSKKSYLQYCEVYLDGTYKFWIRAQNNYKVGKPNCGNNNPGWVIYGVMQEQGVGGCCSGEEEYYERASCQCLPCYQMISNCRTCTNMSVCLSCKIGYMLDSN